MILYFNNDIVGSKKEAELTLFISDLLDSSCCIEPISTSSLTTWAKTSPTFSLFRWRKEDMAQHRKTQEYKVFFY